MPTTCFSTSKGIYHHLSKTAPAAQAVPVEKPVHSLKQLHYKLYCTRNPTKPFETDLSSKDGVVPTDALPPFQKVECSYPLFL